jgi:hypothetical protein
MTTRYVALCTGVLLGAIALGSASAQALTMQECSVKYKAAQTAGTLKGMKWNDFRKAECGADASATPGAAPAAATKPAAAPALPANPTATTTTRPSVAPATPSNAVFPNAVSPKYSSESAGKGAHAHLP